MLVNDIDRKADLLIIKINDEATLEAVNQTRKRLNVRPIEDWELFTFVDDGKAD